MKKFITIVLIAIVIFIIYDICFYRLGLFINFNNQKAPTTFIKSQDKKILIEKENKYEEFEIKGIDLGVGMPGKFATDYSIDKQTYKR